MHNFPRLIHRILLFLVRKRSSPGWRRPWSTPYVGDRITPEAWAKLNCYRQKAVSRCACWGRCGAAPSAASWSGRRVAELDARQMLGERPPAAGCGQLRPAARGRSFNLMFSLIIMFATVPRAVLKLRPELFGYCCVIFLSVKSVFALDLCSLVDK